jgi:hypothetical protein
LLTGWESAPMSYERAKKRLRLHALSEYAKYAALISPYDNPERGIAWHRHELSSDIYRAVRKSKSKSHKAAVAVCKEFVKLYKNKCQNYQDTTKKCLEICEGVK